MTIGYEQQLRKFWAAENLDDIEFVLQALQAKQLTSLALLLRYPDKKLEEEFRMYHQIRLFIKTLPVDEQFLIAIGTDLLTVIRNSHEGLKKEFPIFHEQIERFIKRLPVDEQFLIAIGTDLLTVIRISHEGLKKEFPIFHEQIERFIKRLPVDEQFLIAIGTDLLTVMRNSHEGLKKEFPIFHEQIERFIKRLPVDEQFLIAIGTDLLTVIRNSHEGLKKEFPIFHEQIERFIKRLPVDEHLLKAIGVAPELIVNFKRTNYRMVDDFIAFDNKEQISREFKLDEPSLSKIWKFVNTFVKVSNESSASHVVSRKVFRHVTEETSHNPLALFFMRQLKQEIEFGDVERQLKRLRSEVGSGAEVQLNQETAAVEFVQSLELVENLYGEKSTRKVLFVRNEVRIAVEKAMAWLKDPKKSTKALLLGGGRGTGKTVIGLLVVLRLATEGILVVYLLKNKCLVLFSDRIHDDDRRFLNRQVIEIGISPIPDSQSGVFFLDMELELGRSMYNELFSYERCVIIEDVGDAAKDPSIAPSSGRRMIVTSPNARKLEPLLRIPDATQTLIVPPWELKDILELGGKMVEGKEITVDVIRQRYDRIGGIPRWVNDAPIGTAEQRQNQQIANLLPETLQLITQGMSYGTLPNMSDKLEGTGGMSLDVLFHLQPTDNWPDVSDKTTVNVVLCSKYVANELAIRYVEMENFKVQTFISSTRNLPSLSHFRGYALEASVHKAIKTGTVNMVINRMENSSTVSTLCGIASGTPPPAFHFSRAVRDTDVSVLDAGVYYQPARSNEPTIDSFIIVDRAFAKYYLPDHPDVDNTSINYFIVFFQITVAKNDHIVDGTILRRYQAAAQKSLGESYIPIALVFVTYRDGLRTTQPVTRKDGKKRVVFKRQDLFHQFRAEVKDQLEILFELCAEDKAVLEQAAVSADDARDVVEEEL